MDDPLKDLIARSRVSKVISEADLIKLLDAVEALDETLSMMAMERYPTAGSWNYWDELYDESGNGPLCSHLAGFIRDAREARAKARAKVGGE